MIARILTILALVAILPGLPAAGLLSLMMHADGSGREFLFLFFPAWLVFFGFFAVAVLERRAPIFGRIFWKGAPGSNRVALTFDDGPNEPFTSQILHILNEHKVRATFFPLGKNVERFPDTLKKIAAEGHEIGNHTWSHEVLPLKSPDRIRREITKTSDIVESITGIRPTLFRAPHGWRNPWVNRVARECGCIPVAWTLGVWDTDRPGAATIVERTLKGVRDGCIVLVHDGRGVERNADSSQLVRALPAILLELGRRGFQFVTVTEMMGTATR